MCPRTLYFIQATYPGLLLLFKISVILGVISFLAALCALCIMGTVWVAGLSQMNSISGTGTAYNGIPDSVDEAKKSEQTEEKGISCSIYIVGKKQAPPQHCHVRLKALPSLDIQPLADTNNSMEKSI